MHIEQQFGFYAILTNPLLGFDRLTNIIVDAGIRFIQLRIKDQPHDTILPIANRMRKITENSATHFIINDDLSIACACGADGVHLGQDDVPYTEARHLLGTGKIIGISTHNLLQIESTCVAAPDYIGIGPVFPTPTKKNHDPAIGITGMKEMLNKATLPSVAIGGIDYTNLHQILEVGAKNFCMVRQLTQSPAPENTLREIMRIYRSFYPHF